MHSLLLLRSLEAVVDNILQLLDAEGFQELLRTQLISLIAQYHIRENLSRLLGRQYFPLSGNRVGDSLQRQKVAVTYCDPWKRPELANGA